MQHTWIATQQRSEAAARFMPPKLHFAWQATASQLDNAHYQARRTVATCSSLTIPSADIVLRVRQCIGERLCSIWRHLGSAAEGFNHQAVAMTEDLLEDDDMYIYVQSCPFADRCILPSLNASTVHLALMHSYVYIYSQNHSQSINHSFNSEVCLGSSTNPSDYV